MPSQANLNSIFSDVADSIRSKKGTSAPIYPVDFADEIDTIQTGTTPTLIAKTITENGVYNASSDSADGYLQVTVNVTDATKPTLFAPTLSQGTTSRPMQSNTNAANGGFVSGMVYTINGQSIEEEIHVTSAVETVPWIYSITPLAGGSFTVSASEVSPGFNTSPAATRTVSWPTATETTGYSSVSGLGTSTINTQTYTYDSNFPRSFQEVTDSYGNIFIKIPTIYRKVLSTDNGQITGFALATSKLDASYEPYPCFVDETDNNAILPFVLVGKYCVSNTSTANSVNASATSLSIANGRTLCRNRGTGYQQYDWKFQKLFVDLGLVLSRYVNINQGANVYDVMGIMHQQNAIWVDGVVRGSTDDDGGWYVCDTEANYQNAEGGTGTSASVSEATILGHGYSKLAYGAPTATTYITKLGYDANHPFLNYPENNSRVSGSSSTYYCDYYYYSSGSRPVYCHVGGSGYDYGWFYCGSDYYWNNSFAVRLCFRPIAGATGYVE